MIFFCDTMLGGLAKWLRLLGHDTAYEREIDDWEMVRLCARGGRVLITRDRNVMERWQIARGQVRAYLAASDRPRDQLEEVRRHFRIGPLPRARCPQDNTGLLPLARVEARDRVPPYVYETQKEFTTCATCGRIYWKATHWESIDRIRGHADVTP